MLEKNPATIESRPSLSARFAGFIGRAGVRNAAQLDIAPMEDIMPANDVLDQISNNYEGNVALDPEAEDSKALIKALQNGPRLTRPTFLDTSQFSNRQKGDLSVTLQRSSDPIELPVANFVYANQFKNWDTGRGDYKGDVQSSKVIKDHARRRTEAPPIGIVLAEVQPNGLVLFSSIQDGAHRVAAAHLKHDPTIKVGGEILVRRLPTDLIDLPE
jgi:hypothetical protein